MAPRRRHLLLAGALALTVAAVVLVPEDEAPAPRSPRAPAAAGGGAPATPPPAGETTLADLARKPYTAGDGDLFPPRSWAPPPPPPMAAAAPAGPPPLPFAYIGKMEEPAGPVVFLLHDERTLAVRAGDVIDGTYRVTAVRPQSLELVYLPSKQQQSLSFGSAEK